VNIQDVSRYALRQRIGVVPQETVLFNDTLRYNIAYGNHDASMTQIDAAVEVAGLTGFVRALPDGLETEVGTRGLKLSGGEKQRVAIARAVLKEPAIMIFDEATSSLDTATEAAIQANLERVAAQQTTLIIAHRLSTVTHADRIVVLADGRVAEQGAHQELIDRGGLYAQLWQIQSQSV
jgi:ATP-binding cassette, subfamily B, heavy metal transporter